MGTVVPPDTTDYYLTNKPIGYTYSTAEFGVTKRMSDHWQPTRGFDWRTRKLSSQFSEDPNAVFWSSNNNTQTTGWTFKASGSNARNARIAIRQMRRNSAGCPQSRLPSSVER